MANTLVACGGTGAHAALAMVRLHTLGYALGFFRQPNGKPLEFPTLYLVDQDAGDGAQEETASQMVRRLIDNHPDRYDWRKAVGRETGPDLQIVTPLPVGTDRKWFATPNDKLRRHFAASPYLDLLTDREQRDIRFSQGMMGSPAVGALLFRLKASDATPRGVNHDEVFHALLQREHGRVAVVGSGVGGTGAAVAPTLARKLATLGHDVMAVMVLQWFRFTKGSLDAVLREKADLRNDAMRSNAYSAFAHCGQDLAREVATVPVGVPEKATIDRRYTSDTGQPARESFVHAVAALCCLRQFVEPKPYRAGLYQMGAEDPTKFGGGNAIPGGTLQGLADQAATLANTLDVFAGVLSASHDGSFAVIPAVYGEMQHLTNPRQAGDAVRKLTASYREHLQWMEDILGVKPRPVDPLTLEALTRQRLKNNPIQRDSNTRQISPEQAARMLFHWVADWVCDYREGNQAGLVHEPGVTSGGYWPQLPEGVGITVAPEQAGELTAVPDHNIGAVVDGFVNAKYVSENGWPHPVAVASHFDYAIRQRDATAMRQLEMLLAGLVMPDLLELREVREPVESPASVSLDALVKEFRRTEFPGLARYKVVWPAEHEEVLGFTAPHTLLCAKPPSDPHVRQIWAKLWRRLTDSEYPEHWAEETSPAAWDKASREVLQILSWRNELTQKHHGTPPAWTRVFEDRLGSEALRYATDRRIPVYWGSAGNVIDVHLPKAKREKDDWNTLLGRVPELRILKDESGRSRFEMVDFETPGREGSVTAFWREHLELLRDRDRIGGFETDDRGVTIWTPNRGCVATGEGVRVLDRETVMVPSCSPMRQHPIPGSSTRANATRYPDLPLRSEYIGLVQTESGTTILDLLKEGDMSRLGEFEPTIDDTGARPTATWTLRLKGRRAPLPIALYVDGKPHCAHWMVWPRFRARQAPFWRAYYVYQYCTHGRLRLETLWLDPESNRVQRCKGLVDDEFGSHPIRFDTTADSRVHTGGPPVAFSARDILTEEEFGLYLIPLKLLSTNDEDIKVGVDFGTSHTVASVLADGGAVVRGSRAGTRPGHAECRTNAARERGLVACRGVVQRKWIAGARPLAAKLHPVGAFALQRVAAIGAADAASA